MDVTETERLWILGLLLQAGGEERGFIKDDIPEEVVSMEWIEEHDEEDSESCKSKHTPEGNRLEPWPMAWYVIFKAEVEAAMNELQLLPPQQRTAHTHLVTGVSTLLADSCQRLSTCPGHSTSRWGWTQGSCHNSPSLQLHLRKWPADGSKYQKLEGNVESRRKLEA